MPLEDLPFEELRHRAFHVAEHRLGKYFSRGWICKSPVPPSVASKLSVSAAQLQPKQKYSQAFWKM